MRKHNTVIGLGFGDEGKGLMTDFLCQRFPYALVTRFSGGQQAGHTVTTEDTKHVFSNLGSGTLRGNPTYWSKFCTFDPVGFLNEITIVKEKLKRSMPTIWIDALSPITTPYEILHNRKNDVSNGTCGVGVGSTIKREEEMYSLTFGDIYFEDIFSIKLQMLATHYPELKDRVDLSDFLDAVKQIKNLEFVKVTDGVPELGYYIFESSQGLMLDQNIGFFPHVTRSNTDITNIKKLDMSVGDIWFVTRAYQTRHGNGPMTTEHIPHNILLDPEETNFSNEYQGAFRRGILDVSLLEYAIKKNPNLYAYKYKSRFNLTITCLDHIENEWKFLYEGKVHEFKNEKEFVCAIGRILEIRNVHLSRCNRSDKLEKLELDPCDVCHYISSTKDFYFHESLSK